MNWRRTSNGKNKNKEYPKSIPMDVWSIKEDGDNRMWNREEKRKKKKNN